MGHGHGFIDTDYQQCHIKEGVCRREDSAKLTGRNSKFSGTSKRHKGYETRVVGEMTRNREVLVRQ